MRFQTLTSLLVVAPLALAQTSSSESTTTLTSTQTMTRTVTVSEVIASVTSTYANYNSSIVAYPTVASPAVAYPTGTGSPPVPSKPVPSPISIEAGSGASSLKCYAGSVGLVMAVAAAML